MNQSNTASPDQSEPFRWCNDCDKMVEFVLQNVPSNVSADIDVAVVVDYDDLSVVKSTSVLTNSKTIWIKSNSF